MYLIIGASGFIGSHLYAYCKKNGIEVLGTYYKHDYNMEWVPFDLCSDNLEEFCRIHLKNEIPQVIILCGANASIDSCKRDEVASNMLNVTGTKRILDQAKDLGIKSVFISSEAVFDGRKGMYIESDKPNPINLYGRQKLQVEQHMRKWKNYLIFRVSRAIGSSFGEKDIFNEFYNKIINGEEITCLEEQSFCLTDIEDIVYGIVKALEMGLGGLYHLSSENKVTRYELAQLYAKHMFGGYDKIIEKKYSDFSFLDNRHIYGGLNGEKLEKLLDIKYKSVTEILSKYINSYREV